MKSSTERTGSLATMF